MSVVASPLVRLSMTCWLNACRSASWFDACGQLLVGAPQPLGEVAAQRRDRQEPEDVQADGEERQARSGGSAHGERRRQQAAAEVLQRARARRSSSELSTPTIRPPRRDSIALAAMIGSV